MDTINVEGAVAQTWRRLDGAYAPKTVRNYALHLRALLDYATPRGQGGLPVAPATVAGFVEDYARRRSVATVQQAISAIATLHRLNRWLDPTKDPDVVLAIRRMYRQYGRVPAQVAPIDLAVLQQLLAATDRTLRGARDRALLMVAFDTLCRRSELISLQVEDCHVTAKNGRYRGTVMLRRSKTDLEVRGHWFSLSASAAEAVHAWIEAAELKTGALFRGVHVHGAVLGQLGPNQISRIYKSLAIKSELDTRMVARISAHSTRIGAAQELLRAGASLPMIMASGRWTRVDTVMRYVGKLAQPI